MTPTHFGVPAVSYATAVVGRATELIKVYGEGDTQVVALGAVSVGFHQVRFTAIAGPSGSGKSTPTHCMAGRDTISGGSARIGDIELTGPKDKKLTGRPRAGLPVRDHLRGRAHRQSRLPLRRRGARLPPRLRTRTGPDRRDGHPCARRRLLRGRVVFLTDGRIVDDMPEPTADQAPARIKRFDAEGRTS